MQKKDEHQQDKLKYSIWNTNTDEVHLEHELTYRAESIKKSLKTLGQVSQVEDNKK